MNLTEFLRIVPIKKQFTGNTIIFTTKVFTYTFHIVSNKLYYKHTCRISTGDLQSTEASRTQMIDYFFEIMEQDITPLLYVD